MAGRCNRLDLGRFLMRGIASLLFFLASAVWLPLSSSAQTVNILYSTAMFNLNSNAVTQVVGTPIAHVGGYNGVILVPGPIYPTNTATGSGVFSNLVAGYAYSFEFDTPYSTTYVTNFIPSGTSNNISMFTYQTPVIGFDSLGNIISWSFYNTNNIYVPVIYTGTTNITAGQTNLTIYLNGHVMINNNYFPDVVIIGTDGGAYQYQPWYSDLTTTNFVFNFNGIPTNAALAWKVAYSP
jgi:hypothetical protein